MATTLVDNFSNMNITEVPFTSWLQAPSGQARVIREIQANRALAEYFVEWIESNIQYGKNNGPFLFQVSRILGREGNNFISRVSAIVMDKEFDQFLDHLIIGDEKENITRLLDLLCDLLEKTSILAVNILNCWKQGFSKSAVDLSFQKNTSCPFYQALLLKNAFAIEVVWRHLSQNEKEGFLKSNDFFGDLCEIKEQRIQEIFFPKEEIEQRFSILTTNPTIYNYPLHQAAFRGNTVMIEVLLAGMSRNQRFQCITVAPFGWTPVNLSLSLKDEAGLKALCRFLTRQQKEAVSGERAYSILIGRRGDSLRDSLLKFLFQKRSNQGLVCEAMDFDAL